MTLTLVTVIVLIMKESCAITTGDESQISGLDMHEVVDVNESEGPDLLSAWIDEALPDVAYFLRQHKFNDFDRRYSTEENAVRDLHAKFPSKPLSILHWEVQSNCGQGFIPCLKYLHETIQQTTLQRSMDSVHLISANNWTWPKDRKSIHRADVECRRLREQAEIEPEPFSSTLQRFQWRTSASYFMCMFTMKEIPWLSILGERCDNYAWCMWPNSTMWGEHPWSRVSEWDKAKVFPLTYMNHDPRADDSNPFSCSLYSFCPDTCCSLRHVENMFDCLADEYNPCWMNEAENITCSLDRSKNTYLSALTLNRINVSCSCERFGYIWESRYNACVDVDECADATTCNETTETCLNLDGSYECFCRFGYIRINDTCLVNYKIQNVIEEAVKKGSSNSTKIIDQARSFWERFKTWLLK